MASLSSGVRTQDAACPVSQAEELRLQAWPLPVPVRSGSVGPGAASACTCASSCSHGVLKFVLLLVSLGLSGVMGVVLSLSMSLADSTS